MTRNQLSLHQSVNTTKNLIITNCKNYTSNKKLTSNNKIPFTLNLAAAVDGNIDFDIPLNVKFHKRETTNLEDELYNCVLQDLFKFLEPLNYQTTEFQWSGKVGIMMILKDVLDANTDYVNLLTSPGEINLNMLTKFEETYTRKESRAA